MFNRVGQHFTNGYLVGNNLGMINYQYIKCGQFNLFLVNWHSFHVFYQFLKYFKEKY